MTAMLQVALAYAAAGLRVYPLHHGTKRPHVTDYLDVATTDPETVTAWWAKWPDANVSAVIPARTLVVDVDRHPGRPDGAVWWLAQVRRHGRIRTLAARTPRGGLHIWLSCAPGAVPAVTVVGPGVEVFGPGHQIMLAPSVTADGEYVWNADGYARVHLAQAPPWLVELVTPPPTATVTSGGVAVRSLAVTRHGKLDDSLIARAPNKATVLRRAGWQLVSGNGDSPRSRWRRPGATTRGVDATVGDDGRLYVWSTSTSLPTSTTGRPQGLDDFDVFVLLEYQGDVAAALAALREVTP